MAEGLAFQGDSGPLNPMRYQGSPSRRTQRFSRAPEARQPLAAPSPAWDPGCSQQEHRLLPAYSCRRTSNAQLVNARNSPLPSMENTSIQPQSGHRFKWPNLQRQLGGTCSPLRPLSLLVGIRGTQGTNHPIGQLGQIGGFTVYQVAIVVITVYHIVPSLPLCRPVCLGDAGIAHGAANSS